MNYTKTQLRVLSNAMQANMNGVPSLSFSKQEQYHNAYKHHSCSVCSKPTNDTKYEPSTFRDIPTCMDCQYN